MASWGDRRRAETSVQSPVWVERGNCLKGGNHRHSVTLKTLPKTEVIYKAAARNLSPRQEQMESLVELIQKEERLLSWEEVSWHHFCSEV